MIGCFTLFSGTPALLVFIVRFQRVPCPSERIDNLAIVVGVLVMLQAISSIVGPFPYECILKILREVGIE